MISEVNKLRRGRHAVWMNSTVPRSVCLSVCLACTDKSVCLEVSTAVSLGVAFDCAVSGSFGVTQED